MLDATALHFMSQPFNVNHYAVFNDIATYVKRLLGFGINSVYIEDEIFDDVQTRSCLTDETKTAAMQAVAEAYKNLANSKDLDESQTRHAAKNIASEVHMAMTEPINFFNLYAVNDPRCLHAVNVASIVAALALKYDCNLPAVGEYVTAALLHDIMLEKMDYESNNFEYAVIAAERLKEMRTFPVRTYMSVAMHHEKFDGTGGLRHLSGDKISEGARMIAVADLYDSIVYGYGRPRQNLHLTVEYLNSEANKALDPLFLCYFNQTVAVYPTGATVILNNGLRAVVVNQNEHMPTRPTVRLLMPERTDCLRFNLVTQRTMFIEKLEL